MVGVAIAYNLSFYVMQSKLDYKNVKKNSLLQGTSSIIHNQPNQRYVSFPRRIFDRQADQQ